MWKKDDAQPDQPGDENITRATPVRSTGGRATIGPSISIRGDVTGSEDLLIQGQVDGSVTLDLYSISIGSEGRVNANITGRVITVEGRVEGDLTAQEQIVLRGTAQVQGDIKAPRVVLEDGATFRGLVDMGAQGAPKNAEKITADKTAGPGAKSESAAASPSENGTPKIEKLEAKSDGKSDRSATSSSPTRPSSSGKGKESSDATKQASL